MSRYNLTALVHALSGAGSILASLFIRGQLGIPAQPIKSIGYIVFGLGALLYVYTLFYLRSAFEGNVEPITEDLVSDGPYRWVRHPPPFND